MFRSVVKKRVFAFMALMLGGCGLGDPGAPVLPSRPLAHHSLSSGGAALDARAARDAISTYRQSYGLSPVANDPELQKAAQFQAEAMARADRLGHDVAGPFSARIAAIGRGSSLAVENLSAGHVAFAAAFSGWQGSTPHNRNLLEANVSRMGVAKAYSPEADRVYWALIMTD